jgi:hypothetical protein
MRVHTIIVEVLVPGHSIPPHLGGRAARLLRSEFAEESTTRNWIDSCGWKAVGQGAIVLQIACPNVVTIQRVIEAVNRAVKYELPELSGMDWTTCHMSDVYAMNQDR